MKCRKTLLDETLRSRPSRRKQSSNWKSWGKEEVHHPKKVVNFCLKYVLAMRSPLLWHMKSIAALIMLSVMSRLGWSSVFRQRREALRKSTMHGLVLFTGSLKTKQELLLTWIVHTIRRAIGYISFGFLDKVWLNYARFIIAKRLSLLHLSKLMWMNELLSYIFMCNRPSSGKTRYKVMPSSH